MAQDQVLGGGQGRGRHPPQPAPRACCRPAEEEEEEAGGVREAAAAARPVGQAEEEGKRRLAGGTTGFPASMSRACLGFADLFSDGASATHKPN